MKIKVFFHLYKGICGINLSIQYLSLLKKFTPPGLCEIFIYSYGLNELELDNFRAELKKNGLDILKFKIISCLTSCESEMPTIWQVMEYVRISNNPDEYILYMHSKGASYKDYEKSKIVAESSILALSAAINEIYNGSAIEARYKCFGAFLSLGVFRRYGSMSLAYSGNFWMAKAEYISQLNFPQIRNVNSYSSRHLAEEYLGLNGNASVMFNIVDRCIDSSSELSHFEYFKNVSSKIRIYSKLSSQLQAVADKSVQESIDLLSRQQFVYSAGRAFWGMRKYLFGNNSILRCFKILSRLLDIIFRWYTCELYRCYMLQSHLSIIIGSPLINLKEIIS